MPARTHNDQFAARFPQNTLRLLQLLFAGLCMLICLGAPSIFSEPAATGIFVKSRIDNGPIGGDNKF
jgi:hypothetical protein